MKQTVDLDVYVAAAALGCGSIDWETFLFAVRCYPHCFPASARSFYGIEVRPLLQPGLPENELEEETDAVCGYRLWQRQRDLILSLPEPETYR